MLCVFLGKQLYISKFDGPAGYDLGSSSLTGSMGCSLNGVSPLATDPGFLEDTDNQMPTCLKRAFSNLKLFCLANGLQVSGIRNFTVQNMHAARNAFPWVGCKGSDTIVILKWLCFFCVFAAATGRLVSEKPTTPTLDCCWCQRWIVVWASDPWSWNLACSLMCFSLETGSAKIWKCLRIPRSSLPQRKLQPFWTSAKAARVDALQRRM